MKILVCYAVLWGLFSCLVLAKGPKNVIILIGDGMGVNQVQSAYTQNGEHLNKTGAGLLAGFKDNTASFHIIKKLLGIK